MSAMRKGKVKMFSTDNEDVLVSFKSLCKQYPRENVVALWEMAGGQVNTLRTAGPFCLCPADCPIHGVVVEDE